jgi:single-strand DNA-binding protein
VARLSQYVGIGRLTADPRNRQAGDKQVVSFRIAVNQYQRDKPALFIDCEVWGRNGDYVMKNLAKGREVCVSGDLRMDEWEKDGQKRQTLRLNTQEVQGIGQPPRRDADPGPDKTPERQRYEARQGADQDDDPFR